MIIYASLRSPNELFQHQDIDKKEVDRDDFQVWYEGNEEMLKANDGEDPIQCLIKKDFTMDHLIHITSVIQFRHTKGIGVFHVCLMYKDAEEICHTAKEGQKNTWPVGLEKEGIAKLLSFKAGPEDENFEEKKIRDFNIFQPENSVGCLRWKHLDYVERRHSRSGDTFDRCRNKCLSYGFERFSFTTQVDTLTPECQCIKRNGNAYIESLFQKVSRSNKEQRNMRLLFRRPW